MIVVYSAKENGIVERWQQHGIIWNSAFGNVSQEDRIGLEK